MATGTQLSEHDSGIQATTAPSRKAHTKVTAHKQGTDDIFHLSLFPHLYNNTISLIHMPSYHPSLSDPAASADSIAEYEDNFDEDSEDVVSDANIQVSTSWIPIARLRYTL